MTRLCKVTGKMLLRERGTIGEAGVVTVGELVGASHCPMVSLEDRDEIQTKGVSLRDSESGNYVHPSAGHVDVEQHRAEYPAERRLG